MKDFDSVYLQSKNALDFWRSASLVAPELAQVAQTLLSIRPSEASCERAFSHLAATHTEMRSRLNDPSVRANLFVRMNFPGRLKRERDSQELTGSEAEDEPGSSSMDQID